MDDPDQGYEVFSDSSPIVIRRTNLDDSLTATIFLLRAGPVEGGYVIVANGTRAVDVCGARHDRVGRRHRLRLTKSPAPVLQIRLDVAGSEGQFGVDRWLP